MVSSFVLELHRSLEHWNPVWRWRYSISRNPPLVFSYVDPRSLRSRLNGQVTSPGSTALAQQAKPVNAPHTLYDQSMLSPYSSEATPPRSRQKPGSACDECRRRKLRCDREQPQCGVCSESGVACNTTAIGPSRGPKKGHLKALHARIGECPTVLDTSLQR